MSDPKERQMPPKAYYNQEFLANSQARDIRILAEYSEPQQRFKQYNVLDTVVFFGSARAQSADTCGAGATDAKCLVTHRLTRFYEDARTLARMIIEWSQTRDEPQLFVCTGGGPGIMEGANRGAFEADPKCSIGLNISLPFEQFPNPYITPELCFDFHYFFIRKFWFSYMAKALIVFPGGFGTFDELFELLTLAQTHKLDKVVPIVLYGREYWDKVWDIEFMEQWGVIDAVDKQLLFTADTPEEAMEHLKIEIPKCIKSQQDAFFERYPHMNMADNPASGNK